jgi:hypothetical protein
VQRAKWKNPVSQNFFRAVLQGKSPFRLGALREMRPFHAARPERGSDAFFDAPDARPWDVVATDWRA